MKLCIFISFFMAVVQNALSQDFAAYVDTRVGTDVSVIPSSSIYGSGTELKGQTIPAVLSPNGMNMWTAQTRSTERKCVAPYYYADPSIQGFRCSHWINGGCTQDYGSFTFMVLTDSLVCQPESRALPYSLMHSGRCLRIHQ